MNNKIHNLPVYIYFILATALIIILFPKEGNFRYAFTEGRPWKYGLLTAPFDFPIYKAELDIQREQDSILKQYQPYFQLFDTIVGAQTRQLRNDYNNDMHTQWSYNYLNYIEKALKHVYKTGVISLEDMAFLNENNYTAFKVIEEGKNNIAIQYNLNKIFTIKTAYTYIFENRPADLDPDVLKLGNINNYLTENIAYDPQTSDKVKNELLQKVSPSTGLVQAGQKIIDRGEIVDEKTYAILNSLKIASESKQGLGGEYVWIRIGISLLVISLMACFLMYLHFFREKIYKKKKDVVFMLSLMVLFIVLTEIAVRNNLFNVYIIPYAIIPIAFCTFIDSRTARTAHSITIFICALMLQFPFEFLLLQFITGIVVIVSLKDLTNRSQLIKCSLFVLLTYIIIYIALSLYQDGDWSKINWTTFIYFGINFIFLMFTYAFIYIIEKIFGYTSSVTLVELSDLNSSVLRKLSETCPGTFQHSMQVSMLASAAASKISANPLLIRTGALYHDIGKMKNPLYFTENQNNDFNPHNNLTYEQSAQIIIDHVNEGVKIAEKNRIPSVIIDFIKTHHGRSKTKYFYNSFKNEFPDVAIDESKFTYPGPNPFSKETGILMMADSVEAASRSLHEYTEESITNLVNKIVDSLMNDGLLRQTPLTFRDIENIKSVFIEKLITMYHSRISYPELNPQAGR